MCKTGRCNQLERGIPDALGSENAFGSGADSDATGSPPSVVASDEPYRVPSAETVRPQKAY
jgi:hypothetical protein